MIIQYSVLYNKLLRNSRQPLATSWNYDLVLRFEFYNTY